MNIEDYINRKEIINALIKIRVKLAFSRHKNHLISEITSEKNFHDSLHFRNENVKNKEEFDFITNILPPRRKWIKLNEKERVIYRDSFVRNIHGIELTLRK